MSTRNDHAHHTERARAELDAAYRARGAEAAAAHLRLHAMHLRQAREALRSPCEATVKELDWLESWRLLHERVLLSA